MAAFRPTFWPTMITVPALIVLVALGTWQLQRLHEKTDQIAKLQTRSEAAAVAPPGADAVLGDFEYQKVRVAGRYRHDREMYLVGRSLRGNPGLQVMTPLERSDGKGAILVSRGWVPFDKRDPKTRADGQLPGAVEVEGIVRLEKGQGPFVPDNDPAKNTWYFIDIPAMSKRAGIDLAPGYYIVADKADFPGNFPVGRQWRLDIRNDHLEYAITWYGLAVALLLIYVVYHRQKR